MNIREVEFQVAGMSCSHCVKAVDNEIKELPGIETVAISLEDKTVKVCFNIDLTDDIKIANAIVEAGYEVLK